MPGTKPLELMVTMVNSQLLHINIESVFLKPFFMWNLILTLGNLDFENIEEQAEGIFGGR